MKVLVLFVRIPKNRIARLTRLLCRNSESTGLVLLCESTHTNVSSLEECPIAIFTCRAPESMLPDQFIELMTYCKRVSATVVSMSYVDDVEDDEDDETGEQSVSAIAPPTQTSPGLRLVVSKGKLVE